jgi:AcrR family transcriptional regulator
VPENARQIPDVRRRGRPPKRLRGRATPERLLSAAAEAFAEHGFGGATLADIAARAGVTTGAIYNHFAGKEDLLVVAARGVLEGLAPRVPRALDPAEEARGAAQAFLAPRSQQMRRLLVELHLAATRSPALAALLARWHRERAAELLARIPPGAGDPAAVVKTFFLLLMGLTHLESLSGIPAPHGDVESLAARLAAALFTEP